MIASLVVASLILAFAGHSESQDLDCHKTVECYTKLRQQVVYHQEYMLIGPEPTERNLGAYMHYCRWKAPMPPSPCNKSEEHKDCFKRPDIQARENIYRELWNFVCPRNETWKRFMGILYSKENDPCQGALKEAKRVLKGNLGPCGTVKQLLGECVSQRKLNSDLLQPAMELLGCPQEQRVSATTHPSAHVGTATTQPAPRPPAGPQCDRAGAAHCLSMSAKALETSTSFENRDAQAGQSGCTPALCLENYLLDGCSNDEMMLLTSLQRTIEAVRSAACGNGRMLLKSTTDLNPSVQQLASATVSSTRPPTNQPEPLPDQRPLGTRLRPRPPRPTTQSATRASPRKTRRPKNKATN